MIRKTKSIINKILSKTGYELKQKENLDFLMWIDSYKIESVIDIGANKGQFIAKCLKKLQNKIYYLFEPLSECSAILNRKFEKYSNIHIYNYGLGDINDELDINKNIFTPSSSFLDMTDTHKRLFPITSEATKEKVLIRRLDDWYNEHSLAKNIFIKVDVQGFEDKVIRGGIDTIKNSKILLIELSLIKLYENQLLFDDIYKELKRLDFSYKGNITQIRDRATNEIIQIDALFINKK